MIYMHYLEKEVQMELKRLTAYSADYLSDINSLLNEQSPGEERPISRDDLITILADRSFYMYVLLDEGKIIGMASFFVRRNLARTMAEIHDVVVSSEYRGQGLGERLAQALIDQLQRISDLRDTKIKLYLTSRPTRVAANNLYLKLGFVLVAEATGEWGTNLYKKMITPD